PQHYEITRRHVLKFLNHFKKSRPTDPLEIKIIQARHSFFAFLWDGSDLDLLFYHRKLRRLVAIDLKIGDFEAADKGQMELYLNWLKRHEMEPDEAAPIGMILCAGKSAEHVELLEVEKSGIHVATYWTKVLPKRKLMNKLHQVLTQARQQLPLPSEKTNAHE
ncbi:MAG: PDDEXK nuclease domain-containing protein, partial [Verrucomicrobia bacterium]|nr:PDDEXK nuclease domain-containing protein [Verrucomicrobiota bacterium]